MFVSHGSWNLITKVHISHFLLYSTINSPMYVIFFYLMRSVQYFDTFFGFIQSSLFHSINIPTSINGKFPGNWTLIWLEPCLLVIFGTFSLQNIGFFCLYSHYFINEALHLRFKCVVMCVCASTVPLQRFGNGFICSSQAVCIFKCCGDLHTYVEKLTQASKTSKCK